MMEALAVIDRELPITLLRTYYRGEVLAGLYDEMGAPPIQPPEGSIVPAEKVQDWLLDLRLALMPEVSAS